MGGATAAAAAILFALVVRVMNGSIFGAGQSRSRVPATGFIGAIGAVWTCASVSIVIVIVIV